MSGLEKNVADLTVMDVYDIAAVVGQEFERIIDQHGCESLSRLMPKVVRVLEILEVMVSRSSISPETEELRLELDKLRLERIDRLEKEKKHRKVGPPHCDRHCLWYWWTFFYSHFQNKRVSSATVPRAGISGERTNVSLQRQQAEIIVYSHRSVKAGSVFILFLFILFCVLGNPTANTSTSYQ